MWCMRCLAWTARVYVGNTGRCLRNIIMEHKWEVSRGDSTNRITAKTTELIATKQEYWRLSHATGREEYWRQPGSANEL